MKKPTIIVIIIEFLKFIIVLLDIWKSSLKSDETNKDKNLLAVKGKKDFI